MYAYYTTHAIFTELANWAEFVYRIECPFVPSFVLLLPFTKVLIQNDEIIKGSKTKVKKGHQSQNLMAVPCHAQVY